ncbi:glycosyltransferase family 39 protein [Enterococcus faecalis]|nr:glycosyltransferase family 39 protein [Enterococcus faecalis]
MKIENSIFKLINIVSSLVILLTIFGAVQSDNLNLSELKASHLICILFIIVAMTMLIVSSYYRKRFLIFFENMIFFLKKHLKKITFILIAITVVFQIIIVAVTTAPIGWDVGSIFNGLKNLDVTNESISNYLSMYPNNSFFFFLMLGIINSVNHFSPNIGNTWLFWQLLNIVVLDTGIGVLTVAANRLFSKRVSYLVLYLSMFSLALSPWLLVLYTDSLSFMFVSLVLLVYSFLGKKNKHHFICILFLGILCGITFLIKPSAIIFLIAWTIVFIVIFVANYKKNRKYVNILSVCLFVIGMVSSVTTFTIYKNQQTVIQYDKEKQFPMTHWMMIGLTGSGGYNSQDVSTMSKLKTTKERKEYAGKTIKKRLQDYGVGGYLKFIIKKHFNNTDRGDFGWGSDGTPQKPENKSKSKFQSFFRDFYYQQGKRTRTLRFYMQILWIFTLFGMYLTTVSFDKKQISYRELIIKLTIIGAMMFLLLFEGGRSRYLIQFLPFFYLLSAIGWESVLTATNRRKKENVKTFYSSTML